MPIVDLKQTAVRRMITAELLYRAGGQHLCDDKNIPMADIYDDRRALQANQPVDRLVFKYLKDSGGKAEFEATWSPLLQMWVDLVPIRRAAP